jgi:molybdate transport system substrate-binding protein
LENVLHCLLADFAVQHPAASVRAICGASDELADAILNGVHVDLFLSAADGPLDNLKDAGLLASSRPTLLCTNRLAAISNVTGTTNLRSPTALLHAEMHSLALADPSCPLGAYSRSYLESLGLWNVLRPRALFLDNPRVVVAAVESGQADVGVVYRSDAETTPACRILFKTGPNHPEIRYTAALTRRGEQSASASALLAFLTSLSARRRLQHFGFLPPRLSRPRRRS